MAPLGHRLSCSLPGRQAQRFECTYLQASTNFPASQNQTYLTPSSREPHTLNQHTSSLRGTHYGLMLSITMATNDILHPHPPAQNPTLHGSSFAQSGCVLGLLAFAFTSITVVRGLQRVFTVILGGIFPLWQMLFFVRGGRWVGKILMKVTACM